MWSSLVGGGPPTRSGDRLHPDAAPLVTLHVHGVTARRVPAAMSRMARDRGALRRTPGLRFWKLLGTGDGRTFTVRDADPRRWALLAVWDGAAALAAFERRSPVTAAWRRFADERWRADLVPLRSRGTWARHQPFEPVWPGPWDGPVAAVTRARIRPSRSRTFWRAVPPVALDAQATPGLAFALGIGESPIGLQGTFSVWDSAADLAAFAYRGAPHRQAVADTARLGWYAEELFARFAVLQTTGTVDAHPVPTLGGHA